MTAEYESVASTKTVHAAVGTDVVSIQVAGGEYESDSTIALDRANASSFAVSLLQELGYDVDIRPERLKIGSFALVVPGESGGHGGKIVKIVDDDRSGLPYQGELANGSAHWFEESDLEPLVGEYEVRAEFHPT